MWPDGRFLCVSWLVCALYGSFMVLWFLYFMPWDLLSMHRGTGGSRAPSPPSVGSPRRGGEVCAPPRVPSCEASATLVAAAAAADPVPGSRTSLSVERERVLDVVCGEANYVSIQLPVPLGRPSWDDALLCPVPSAHRRWRGPRVPAQCWAGRCGLPTGHYCLCPGASRARGARAAHTDEQTVVSLPPETQGSSRILPSAFLFGAASAPVCACTLSPGVPRALSVCRSGHDPGAARPGGQLGAQQGGRLPFLLLSTVSGLIVSSVDFWSGERF